MEIYDTVAADEIVVGDFIYLDNAVFKVTDIADDEDDVIFNLVNIDSDDTLKVNLRYDTRVDLPVVSTY